MRALVRALWCGGRDLWARPVVGSEVPCGELIENCQRHHPLHPEVTSLSLRSNSTRFPRGSAHCAVGCQIS